MIISDISQPMMAGARGENLCVSRWINSLTRPKVYGARRK